jgi:hypothetical protein
MAKELLRSCEKLEFQASLNNRVLHSHLDSFSDNVGARSNEQSGMEGSTRIYI